MTYSRLDVGFHERATLFKESLRNRHTKNVVYFSQTADPGTFRYRGYNVCQAVERSPVVRAHFFLSHEIPDIRPHLRDADAFVFVRMLWSPKVETLIEELKAFGKSVQFDLDDLIFDDRYLTLVIKTLGRTEDDASINHLCAYMNRVNKTASLCDGFTCTNEFLAEKLRERYGRIVRVVPNLMNREQADVSAQLVARGRPLRRRFLVGYFSGSPSHDNDFRGISDELLEFLRRRDDAELAVVGILNLPPELEALRAAGRVRCEPLKSYLDLQESIWGTDVTIVPLAVNDFTNCKSALKFFEAAAVGVPTIASPAHSYRQAIRHGDNGLLCEPGEWLEALERVHGGWRPDPSGLAGEARSRYLNESRRADIEAVLLAI